MGSRWRVEALLTVLLTAAGCVDRVEQPVSPAMPVVINEFMASNQTHTIVDGAGEADDWIELYNAGDAPVDLGQLRLSDDAADLTACRLQDSLLAPGSYYLAWADGQATQGGNHLPFKLDADQGEVVYLSILDGQVVDSVDFRDNAAARVPSRSYGRCPDGASTWALQATASPGQPNGCTSP